MVAAADAAVEVKACIAKVLGAVAEAAGEEVAVERSYVAVAATTVVVSVVTTVAVTSTAAVGTVAELTHIASQWHLTALLPMAAPDLCSLSSWQPPFRAGLAVPMSRTTCT